VLHVLLLALAGCPPAPHGNPPDDDDDVGGEGEGEGEPAERFEPCTGSGCIEGLTCINPEGRAGGTCTGTCDDDDDCVGGGVCAETSPRVCALGCANADCPEGTECAEVEGRSVCLGPELEERECFEGAAKLDLLFMIDDSNSMAQEQANLTQNFGRLVDALVDPPDRNDDGYPDWEPLEDMHVGVVSSDVGTGGHVVQTCDDPAVGDDGALLHAGNTRLEGCVEDYPPYLEGPRDGLPEEFTCIATLGTGGCGFEQQLESVRRALVDRIAGPNAGFLRDDTALAIVMVTDEDDCSASNPAIFDPSRDDLGVMNLRCHRYPELITPTDVFVDAFLSLRVNPQRLTVAAITGVPRDLLVGMGPVFEVADFDAILDAPGMQFVVDGKRLIPSCDVAGLGEAIPPRRIVQVLRDVASESPGSAYLGSICSPDWTDTVEGLAASIGRSLCAPIE
jgi:hypothetical protein